MVDGAAAARRRRSLRVYVYDLPPKFNTWLAAHFRRPGRWDQSYLYSLDAKLHRWLLHSPHRTFDPKEADYFFVPAYLHLGFYDYEFGLYWLSPRGNAFCNEVFRYVQRTWPYYNASRGADRVFVMTNDKAPPSSGSVPPPAHPRHPVGLGAPHIHHRETDVVVPPMLKVDKLLGESPFLNGDWLGRAAASAGGGVSARLQPGEVLNASRRGATSICSPSSGRCASTRRATRWACGSRSSASTTRLPASSSATCAATRRRASTSR